MTTNQELQEQEAPNHWQLIRDLLGFQFKLALDGLRDLILLPVSLLAGVAGLVFSPSDPGRYFNELLAFGRKSDVWINLFGAGDVYARSDPEAPTEADATKTPDDDSLTHVEKKTVSSDEYINRLEAMLIAEYRKGGVVKNLKDRTDHLLTQIRKETGQDV